MHGQAKVVAVGVRRIDGGRICSARRRALCARRPRGRQAVDRVVGSLGTGREQSHRSACERVGGKEKVEVQMDFIPSAGQQAGPTIAAESQAKIGT